MDVNQILGTVLAGIMVAFFTGIYAWSGRLRKRNNKQDQEIAGLLQFKQNNLDPGPTGERPMLANHELRIKGLEAKIAELDQQGDRRFSAIMQKLEEMQREGNREHRDMEVRIESRLDTKIELLVAAYEKGQGR